MTSYREHLLERPGPLEDHEVHDLAGWLSALRDDVRIFGETTEDADRMARIEARIAGHRPDAPPVP